MLPEQQQRIMGYFIEEAKDHLNTIEQGLLNLQTTIQDGEKANELFRAAHSVKGGAAMLGIESIQRTAHRMEDYFKVLKESPVQVDRMLETMFLRISDGLKDLLEQLEGPFGLTPDKAQEIMVDVEPVFGQLEAHLESLVGQAGAGASASEIIVGAASLDATQAVQTSFKRDVAALLRQLLATFKQADNLESRKTLQNICKELAAIGEQFDLAEWCDLVETARIAVGELNNDYRKLAPILIKEIKKAQELVLTGRASEVAVSDSMQALLPEDLLTASLPLLAETEEGRIDNEEIAANFDSANRPAIENNRDDLADLLRESSETEDLLDTSVDADDIDFEALFEDSTDDPVESAATDAEIKDAEVKDTETKDNSLKPVNRLSVDLEFDEIPSELSALNRNATSEGKADESLDALLATVNVTGPDVGSEELNSLASLFDGDLDELDNTLGNHAFVSKEMQLNPEGIESASEEDMSDLFTEETFSEETSSEEIESEEDGLEEDLFGGTLTNEGFVTLDDSFINTDELELLSISSEVPEENIVEGASENLVGEDATEEFEELEFGDIWAEDNLLEDLEAEPDADINLGAGADIDLDADAAIESVADNNSVELTSELLEEPTSQNNFDSDLTALEEDIWAEDSLLEEDLSLPRTVNGLETESLSTGLEADEIAELSLESSPNSLELDFLDTDTELEGLAATDRSLDISSKATTEAEYNEQIHKNGSASKQSTMLSLTEQLIEKQSVSPRELDIEFPTLTGEKLQEAEEDIDSFFVGEPEDIEIADASEDLFEDESWSDLSLELSTTAEEDAERSLSLDFDNQEVTSSTELESGWDEEIESNSNVNEANLEAVFAESDEETSNTLLSIEEAGSELDAMLEDSTEEGSVLVENDADEYLEPDDLWAELNSNSDLLDAQNAEEHTFESSLVEELSDRTAIDNDIDNDFEEFSRVDPADGLGSTADDEHSLSEADLLDFDKAFGIGALAPDDLSAGDTEEKETAQEQKIEGSDKQDFPTFSRGLDEFAEAADGETTISDIADLRLDDAELDSLLGLDFAVEPNEQNRGLDEELDDRDEQTSKSIDSSVIDAFSDVDDLFNESMSLDEPDRFYKDAEDASQSGVDAFDFFDSADEELNSEADTTDFGDFEDLDALLLEDPDVPAQAESVAAVKPVSSSQTDVSSEVSDDEDFEDLERLLEDGETDSRETSNRRVTARTPRRSAGIREQNMRVSVKHLDDLSNLVGELVVSRNTLERDQERLRQFLDNLLFQVQQLNDVGQRLRDLYERSLLESSLMSNRRTASANSSIKTAETGHATGATFDALEMDRFTGFHSLSQEMIELIVRVRESSSDISYTVESSDQVTRQFRQITTQLQEGLNTARMVAFSQAADRLPRAVRDISLKCGKEANLVVEGEDTLIDKMIVEHLYDPLTHLVNNAITHGIEMPEARKAAGKPPEGRITVRAFYQGNQTVIYVADDGGGINTKFVQQKAIEKGLISQTKAENLSDLETYDLLFHPGFSTRDKADDFAGRGVGMDVVRTSLAEIRGSITIDSELGKGTSFTIRLPLTLSISKALSCVSSQARIAFPMDGVEDMLDVTRDRIVQNDRGEDCVRWRDTLLPFQPITNLLKFNRKLGRSRVYGGSQEDDVLSVIVLRSANTYVAVQVDQVIGEEEIVIKQLEGPVPKPLGIAGATVLGDGRVMPIADVLELIDIATGRVRRESSSMMWTQENIAETEEAPAKSEPTVLIVDDSITVRELLSMSFNKVGYRVEQARDGQEAWDKLRSGLPCDLVFCDIEMPRMDGLELLSQMQKDSQLKQIPIAMLTSRGADRHRQMAVDLGASGYFTKPYLEEALLDAAQRMLNGETLEKGRGG